MDQGYAVVVDIGKTLSKITLWSRDGRMLEKYARPNQHVALDGIRRLDERGISGFIRETLAGFAAHPVEYIIPVAHGAAVVAIQDDAVAFAPIDYEESPPEQLVAAYRALRDPFCATGSPPLPNCLNFGMQLFWADIIHPEARDARLLPWAQYWAWFLSGESASEVTSLACHSDLWVPAQSQFSPLARDRGWAGRFAPLARAGDVIGQIRPELARATGLRSDVRIMAGLHDSNAALLAARGFPQIEDDEATILSTGTWFIAMRLARAELDLAALPQSRDCLVNVDPFGEPIPSARFMGGREIECLIEIDTRRVDIKPDQPRLLNAVPDVLRDCAMVLPTLAPGTGPYPGHSGGWTNRPEDWIARRAGACLYAALLTDASLDLIGSRNKLLVEGRFAEAEVFVRALASLRPEMKIYTANAHNDVSFGAMRLIDPSLVPAMTLHQVAPLEADLTGYRAAWHRQIAGLEGSSPLLIQPDCQQHGAML